MHQAPTWAHTAYDSRSDRGDRVAMDKHSEENGLAHPDPKWSRSARQKPSEVAGAPSSVQPHVHGVGHGHHGHDGCLVTGNVPRRTRPSDKGARTVRPPPPPVRDESVGTCLKRRSDVKSANKISSENPLAFGWAPRAPPARLVARKGDGKDEMAMKTIREGKVRSTCEIQAQQRQELADKRAAHRTKTARAKDRRRQESFSSGRW